MDDKSRLHWPIRSHRYDGFPSNNSSYLPYFAATAYRRTIKEAEDEIAFPKIPVLPIGYGDALELLK